MVDNASSQTTHGNADPLAIMMSNPDEFPIERFLTYRLTVLSNVLNRQMTRLLTSRFDIALPEWRVVTCLGRFCDMSIRDIAMRTQMDKALTSRAVTKLIQRELVSSRPDPADGRLVLLSVTSAGRLLYETILPVARERQARLFNCLEADERIVLDRALGKLITFARNYEGQNSEDIEQADIEKTLE